MQNESYPASKNSIKNPVGQQIARRMKEMRWGVLAALAICGATGGAYAQSPAGRAIPVTADNFNRAETDMVADACAKMLSERK